MAKFKLGRIKVDSWTQLNKLKYNEDKFDLECIPRSVLFSRLYSIDIDNCVERLMIGSPTDFYVTETSEFGKGVYTMDDDGNFSFKNKYRSWLAKDLKEVFLNKTKRSVALQKLSGKQAVSLFDNEFQNGDNLNIIIKDGDKEYTCVTHTEYINIIYKVFTPTIKDNNLDMFEVKHENIFYRLTSATQNSYIGIPKDSMYVLQNINKEDENFNKCRLYQNNKLIGETNNMDSLVKEYQKDLFNNAKNSNDFIDASKCEVFVEY